MAFWKSGFCAYCRISELANGNICYFNLFCSFHLSYYKSNSESEKIHRCSICNSCKKIFNEKRFEPSGVNIHLKTNHVPYINIHFVPALSAVSVEFSPCGSRYSLNLCDYLDLLCDHSNNIHRVSKYFGMAKKII